MKKSTLFAAALAALAWSAVLPAPAHASETEVVMGLLLKKGIITQAEYDQVMAELRGMQHEQTALAQRVEELEGRVAEGAAAGGPVPEWVNKMQLSGGVTMVTQGTSNLDLNADNNDDDVQDGTLSFDLMLEVPVGQNGLAGVAIEGGDGGGVDEELASLVGVNGDALGAGTTNLNVLEAWYEHNFLDGRLTFTVGKVDLSNYFDGNDVAGDETSQFLSPMFINDAAIEWGSGAGARLTYQLTEQLAVGVGVQEPNGDFEDIYDDTFVITEAALSTHFNGLAGNYRIHYWRNGGNHTSTSNAAATREDGSGFGLSIDQQVSNAITLFARAGWRDDDLAEYAFSTAWSGGLAVHGALWGRDNDTLGIAYGQLGVERHYTSAAARAYANHGDEGHLEVYYSYYFNDYVSVTPDFQLVSNRDGNDSFDSVWVAGLRMQISF